MIDLDGAYNFCNVTCGINKWFLDAFIAKMTGKAMPMPEFVGPGPEPKYDYVAYEYTLNGANGDRKAKSRWA